MLKACEAGSLPALQHLFQLYDIKQGSQPAWEEREESPPRTWKMVETAIINGQVPIVAYILSVYSAGPIKCEPVVQAIIDHPCMETMKLVHQNSPGIVNLGFDTMQKFLSSACSNSADSESLALIHHLLDNGASPNEGQFHGWGALMPALWWDQPFEVL